MNKPVIKFANVTKTYSMFKKKSDKLFEILFQKSGSKSFSALSNVSFEVNKGETIGIIGINGSGKSTLSSLLAEVTPPTSGTISIKGETSLVAISAGLNNFLTGMENIELKCMMHGLTQEEIKKVTPDIIEFADIGEFINQPIKSYSSGMKSRLGFAISAHIQPDILVVDEALSVGDSTFYQKCLNKFDEFKKQGKTIIFISHSLSQVQSISDRILWLNFGRIKMFGDKDEVAKEYTKFIKWFNELSKQEQKNYRKKMLNTQKNVKDSTVQVDGNFVPRKSHSKNKKNRSLFYQFTLLITMLMLSILLMFVENPVAAIKKGIDELTGPEENGQTNEEYATEDDDSQNDTIDIKKNGIINVRVGQAYQDVDLNNLETELPFASEVFVEEEIKESIYKVRLGDKTEAYIASDEVDIIEGLELTVANYPIEDFVQVFPDSFRDSYAYFFAFLGADYDHLKSSLQGLTDEVVNQSGDRTLIYGYDNISYIFEGNLARSIEIRDINVDLLIVSNLKLEPRIVPSDDDTMFYFITDEYEIVIDFENRSMLFRII